MEVLNRFLDALPRSVSRDPKEWRKSGHSLGVCGSVLRVMFPEDGKRSQD